MSRAASGQHPLPLDFYHTFVLLLPCFYHFLPCFQHTSTAFLLYFNNASTMLQPYCYHAPTGVYLLGNQWCSPGSLVSDLTSSGFSLFPMGSQYHSSFNADGGRLAELGSLSSGAKMAMKIFVKRVFTIFVSNASFLRVIANLQN